LNISAKYHQIDPYNFDYTVSKLVRFLRHSVLLIYRICLVSRHRMFRLLVVPKF